MIASVMTAGLGWVEVKVLAREIYVLTTSLDIGLELTVLNGA